MNVLETPKHERGNGALKKMFILLFLGFFFFSQKANAQKPIFYCGYTSRDVGDQLCLFQKQSGFTSNEEAKKAVDQIMAQLGLFRSFVLVSCPDIENAIAITPEDGLRYIIYDNEFISRLRNDNIDWAALSIFAHEIGHHLSGHTLTPTNSLEKKRENELQADYFSGFQMQKLGATLAEAQMAVNQLASEGDDTYDDHPSKSKRLLEIQKGYDFAHGLERKGLNLNDPGQLDFVQTEPGPEFYFNMANDKASKHDYEGAIKGYDKAIELKPDFSHAYFLRGQAKREIKDFQGAIADYSEAIGASPDYPDAFYWRGMLYYNVPNYDKCISDLTRAIEILETPKPLAYFYRGMALERLGNLDGAINDFNKAIELAPEPVYYLNRGRARYDKGDFSGANSDYSQAILLDPTLELGYLNRGYVRLALGDYDGSIDDMNHWLTYDPKDIMARKAIVAAYMQKGDYQAAISHLNQIIEEKPTDGEAYYRRGQANKSLYEYDKALSDFNKAAEYGMYSADLFYARGNIHFKLRNIETAIQDLTKSINLDPNKAEVYYLRALCYQILGETSKMCSDLKTACSRGSQQACNELATLCK